MIEGAKKPKTNIRFGLANVEYWIQNAFEFIYFFTLFKTDSYISNVVLSFFCFFVHTSLF